MIEDILGLILFEVYSYAYEAAWDRRGLDKLHNGPIRHSRSDNDGLQPIRAMDDLSRGLRSRGIHGCYSLVTLTSLLSMFSANDFDFFPLCDPAFLAISDRLSGVNAAALAFPPFRPNACACLFFIVLTISYKILNVK